MLPSLAELLEQACEAMSPHKKIQYICAVALIFSSIAMVAYQVFEIQDVATGLLFYVGQAFLLAGSIFGLSYYVDEVRMKK